MFAWGATMVFAATGRRAFPGTSPSAVAFAVLHKEPELDGLDGDLAEIVRACLHKDPAERPTATEASERLRGLPTSPPPPAANATAPDQDDPPPKSKRRALLIAATVAAIIAIAGAIYIPFLGDGKGDAAGTPATHQPTTPQTPSTTTTATSSSKKPHDKEPTETPSGKHSESPKPQPEPTKSEADPPPKHDPPPNSGPKTLGTLSSQDYGNYCRAHGYEYSAIFGDSAVCSHDREGQNGTVDGPTAVCRWKYSGQPNVRANGRTCSSNP